MKYWELDVHIDMVYTLDQSLYYNVITSSININVRLTTRSNFTCIISSGNRMWLFLKSHVNITYGKSHVKITCEHHILKFNKTVLENTCEHHMWTSHQNTFKNHMWTSHAGFGSKITKSKIKIVDELGVPSGTNDNIDQETTRRSSVRTRQF